MYFNNNDAYVTATESSNSCLVGIGSDVGIYFVQNSTVTRPSTVSAAKKRDRCKASKAGSPTTVLKGVDKGTWWIGRIQKMRRRAGGTSWGSLKQPVDIGAQKPMNPNSCIQLILHYYSRATGQYKFKYNVMDSQWIGVESIITNVTLMYNPDSHIYSLDVDDAEILNNYLTTNIV